MVICKYYANRFRISSSLLLYIYVIIKFRFRRTIKFIECIAHFFTHARTHAHTLDNTHTRVSANVIHITKFILSIGLGLPVGRPSFYKYGIFFCLPIFVPIIFVMFIASTE